METTAPSLLSFLDHGGEIGQLIKAYNWEQTSLGKIEQWPISFRTTIGTMLHAKYPMFLFWGKDYLCFYNDAFIPSFGKEGNHPAALGQPGAQCWSQNWATAKPRVDAVLQGSEGTMHGGLGIPLFRNGKLENIQWTFGHSAVRNDSGEIEGVLILCNESVNESLTKLHLEESMDELEFAIDAAEMATFDYDPVTNKFTGNERLRKWFGVALEGEVDFELASLAIVEEDRDRVNKAIQDSFVFANGGGYEIEYTIRNVETSEERVIMARGRTCFNEDQQPYRFNGILLDITRNITAEKKVRDSEESFRLLTVALPHLVWITDKAGEQIYISESWTEYTGHQELNIDTWNKIVHPTDLEAINLKWMNSLNTGENYTSEVRLKRFDDEYRWHKVEGVPMINSQGEIIRWIGAFTNIHDQILREEQKDEFIAIASHEMKTPLTTAKGYLELLLLTLSETDLRSVLYAKKASEALKRLQGFITELLDVSKIQNGKINYNIEPFDLVEMIQEALYSVQVTSSQHKIQLDTPHELIIEGDKLRLMQVVVNLLSNAIKYSPEADTIILSVAQVGNLVEVRVEDKGIGLAEEHLKNVFVKFYRVHEHEVHYQGLGVGLYISNEIVERHNGEMWAESQIGKGSTFCFRLPIVQI